jgi:hypothetical protein
MEDMNSQIPDWLALLIAWLTVVGMIYGGFAAGDQLLRPSTKRQIGAWLGGERKDTEHLLGSKWTERYLEFFDNILVPPRRRGRSFPMPGFFRSAGVSLAFTASLALIYGILEIIRLDAVNDLESLPGWTGVSLLQRVTISMAFFSCFLAQLTS